MELNKYGTEWVDQKLCDIDEDAFYASIGANDLEAFTAYCRNQREALTAIALRHQDDPEFQARNIPEAERVIVDILLSRDNDDYAVLSLPCDNCDGTGLIVVPSMLGYGEETYACTKCNALSPDERERVAADTLADIHRRIA